MLKLILINIRNTLILLALAYFSIPIATAAWSLLAPWLLAQAISECPEGRTDLRIADQLVKEGRHYQALRALRKLIGQKAFGEGENKVLV